METGNYSQVGNWWDKQGGNEIDIIALDEFSHTGLIAEVKRNERKLSMSKMEEKVARLPVGSFSKYQFALKGLSIQDM